MKRSPVPLSLILAFLSLLQGIINNNGINAASGAETKYVWAQAIAPGKGCWPDCAEGQWCWPKSCSHYGEWPMTIVPLVAFGKLWMIGGKSVWSSQDGLRWKYAQSNAQWGERYGMTGALFKNRIWRMGGMEMSWDNFKNDVWSSSDGLDWKLATRHAGWSPRRGHSTLVFDEQLWVLGGAESSGHPRQLPTKNLNDVWSSRDGINWAKVTDRAPWSGSHNSVVFRNKMWVIGSEGVWSSRDGRNWARAVSPERWLERGGNGAAGCLVFDEKIWFFGGRQPTGTLNDVWSSNDGIDWQQVAAHAPWTPRGTEYSVVFNNKLWIFGGKTGREEDGFSVDVWHMTLSGSAPDN